MKSFCVYSCTLVTVLFSSVALSQEKTGANTVQDNAGSNDKLSVWSVPAEQKVRPDDRVESSNLVWSAANKKISVAGAGNEHVPFQVVITSPVPPGRRPQAPGGFFITASDLKSKEGKIVPKNQVNLYLQHYIMLYGKSSSIGETGYWPDA